PAQSYRYGGDNPPPPVHELATAIDFAHEVLHVYHYNPGYEHAPGWVVSTDRGEHTVRYTIDLGGEPSGLTSYLLLHADTSQSDQTFGFSTELNGGYQAEFRVRQYYSGEGQEYYVLRNWAAVSGSDRQEFTVSVDKGA